MTIFGKNGKICAYFLMIILLLGCCFCFFFLPSNKNLFKKSDTLSASSEITLLENARSEYENQVTLAIQSMLDVWLGAGKSQVRVRAEMDFEQNQQTRELLDIDNPALAKAQGDSVEYTYSKQTILSSQKSGQVKHLSIAVLLNTQELALSDKMRTDLRKIVEQSAGFNAARGDTLELVETSFAPISFFSQSVLMPSVLAFALILLFVLFGVIMTKNGIAAQQIEPPPAVLPAFTNPAVVNTMTNPVSGQVAPNALKKATDLLQKKPDETLTLLRGWLCQSEGEGYES